MGSGFRWVNALFGVVLGDTPPPDTVVGRGVPLTWPRKGGPLGEKKSKKSKILKRPEMSPKHM